MRFKIDLKIFILIIIFILTKQIKIYAMIMLFAIIHEFGHLIAGILLGMKPEKFNIKLFGVSIDFSIRKNDYNNKIKKANYLEIKKIFIALAGPLTNILITIFLIVFNSFNINNNDRLLMIFSNIVLIIFNILPIYPLDGGRILKGLIYIFRGKYIAEKYIHNISYIILIILTMISSVAVLYLKNVAIFFAIIFLWLLQIKENMIYRNRRKIYKIISQDLQSHH